MRGGALSIHLQASQWGPAGASASAIHHVAPVKMSSVAAACWHSLESGVLLKREDDSAVQWRPWPPVDRYLDEATFASESAVRGEIRR